jgi:hypothetical protein
MEMNTLRSYRWSQLAQASLRIPRARRPADSEGAGDAAVRPRPRWNPQAAVYWRRRLVALVIGLAVLALIAWAFSGALGGGATGTGHPAAGHGAAGHGTGSSGQGGSGQGGAAAAPAAAASAGTQGSHAAGHHAQAATGQPTSCHHGDVVLSLVPGQESYSPGQLPQFSVDVVSTSPATCTFNVGASHVALVIRSGSVRVWSSADCVQGAGNLASDLQRGVPTVLSISWNRQASSPGCPATSEHMPAGTYTATVADGRLTSNTISFRIS